MRRHHYCCVTAVLIHLSGSYVAVPVLDALWFSLQENAVRIPVLPSSEWEHRCFSLCICNEVSYVTAW